MKYKSPVYSQASGSIAGLTYSHNQGGLYARARTIPTNPSTAQQQAIRNAVSQLTQLWSSTLTDTQRDGWTTYAAAVPITDTLGDPRNIGALAMYVRCNVPRLQASLARIDDAPTVYTLGDATGLSVSNLDPATEEYDVNYTNTDAWADTGGALLIYSSRPTNQTVNFFKGPYRLAGMVLGNTSTPPTSPETVTSPFPFAAGNRLHVQIRATLPDGRLTSPYRFQGDA